MRATANSGSQLPKHDLFLKPWLADRHPKCILYFCMLVQINRVLFLTHSLLAALPEDAREKFWLYTRCVRLRFVEDCACRFQLFGESFPDNRRSLHFLQSFLFVKFYFSLLSLNMLKQSSLHGCYLIIFLATLVVLPCELVEIIGKVTWLIDTFSFYSGSHLLHNRKVAVKTEIIGFCGLWRLKRWLFGWGRGRMMIGIEVGMARVPFR